MDAFVRRLAALTVLWSLCELLVPEGSQRRLVRMTVSALVMITLLASAGELFSGGADAEWALPAMSDAEPNGASYAEAALGALANQAESAIVRVAERAGYDASAAVYLRRDGALDHIRLTLARREGAAQLVDTGELKGRLAALFETEEANIHLTDGESDE